MHILFPNICIHCKAQTKQLVCETCAHFFEFLPRKKRYCACFQEIESVATFTQTLRQTAQARKAAISFLIIQLSKQRWPTFDLVTSIPKRHPLSSNISEQLAKEFAQRMQLPYKKLAKRKWGDLPMEETPQFELKKTTEAKRILIIDDYMRTGNTIKSLAKILRTQMQANVYGLVVTQK